VGVTGASEPKTMHSKGPLVRLEPVALEADRPQVRRPIAAALGYGLYVVGFLCCFAAHPAPVAEHLPAPPDLLPGMAARQAPQEPFTTAICGLRLFPVVSVPPSPSLAHDLAVVRVVDPVSFAVDGRIGTVACTRRDGTAGVAVGVQAIPAGCIGRELIRWPDLATLAAPLLGWRGQAVPCGDFSPVCGIAGLAEPVPDALPLVLPRERFIGLDLAAAAARSGPLRGAWDPPSLEVAVALAATEGLCLGVAGRAPDRLAAVVAGERRRGGVQTRFRAVPGRLRSFSRDLFPAPLAV
jgi:hypothetical protein